MIAAMTARRPRRSALAPLLVLALAAGCGASAGSPSGQPGPTSKPIETAAPSGVASPAASPSAAPTPAASAAVSCSGDSAAATFNPVPVGADTPTGAAFAGIESAVETIRGIKATASVPRNTLDPTGLCAFLVQSWERDSPADYVAATETLYKLLGLLPRDASLEQLYLDLLGSQVVGFYDVATKSMYVISTTGEVGTIERITYAHEYDHALQDQAFGIKKVVGTALDQGDRSLARRALVEGDATLLMSLWAQKNLTLAELGSLSAATDPASQAALDASPPILKETLMWPYTTGLMLTLGAYQTSASFDGVNALWKNPPDTTEQLLHADKLASREPARPVELPAGLTDKLGAGWKVGVQDTFGELQLGILARTGDSAAGTDPAVGWGGDRVSLLEGPNGAQAAIVGTVWDTPQAAADYFAKIGALATRLNADGGHATVAMPSDNAVTIVAADSDATLGLLAVPLNLAQ